jgi:integrase/recombinase XerD
MMKHLIEGYLLFFSGHAAASTQVRVRIQLRCFLRYLNSHVILNPYQLNGDVLELWILSLRKERDLSPQAVKQNVSVVHGFVKWLIREEHLLFDPMPEDAGPGKTVMPLRQVPAVHVVRDVLERSSHSKQHPFRNRAILELAYGCGLRRMEMAGLNVSDIGGDVLRVRGKGRKERILPLNVSAREAIEDYVRRERPELSRKAFGDDRYALFLSLLGRRLSLQSISAVFRLQVKAPFSPHQLRHACATHMLRNGCDIRYVGELLGHARLSTTQIYTQVLTTDLRQMLERHHPMESIF